MVLRARAQEASEKLARANIRASQFQQKYKRTNRHHVFDRNKVILNIGDYVGIWQPRKHTLQVNAGGI